MKVPISETKSATSKLRNIETRSGAARPAEFRRTNVLSLAVANPVTYHPNYYHCPNCHTAEITLGAVRETSLHLRAAKSLDVTLAYLKGKDAESEEAQEHANSSSLALYA